MKKPLDKDLNKVYESFNQNHNHLRQKFMASLPNSIKRHKRAGRISHILAFTGETIMTSRKTKFAAAAVIIIAFLICINQFGGSVDVSSVALAQVAKNMEAIHSYTCRMTSWQRPAEGAEGETKEVTMQYSYSDQYGFKMEQYADGELNLIVCILRESNEGMRVWPKEKKYGRMQLTEEDLAILKPQEMDPREYVNLLLATDYKSLGQDVIDGVKVEGLETNETAFSKESPRGPSIKDHVSRIWIDVESELPVRLEEEYTHGSVRSGGGADRFQWNVEITPADLEPVIPDDYTRL
ncbi:MAG: hypothetical protein GY845_26590 [Planctomycetes bacterium]|nr:hypothetical protein [Planctomycetota bacterium]